MRSGFHVGDLLRALDAHAGVIPLRTILAALENMALDPSDLGQAVVFNERAYQRVTIRRTPHYEALVLCWRSGQCTPIHNHSGSSCGVVVVQGEASETVYEISPCGKIVPRESHSLPAGSVTGSCDREMHQLGNLQPPGCDLITLHVYSPPPSDWSYFRLGETTLADHDQLIFCRPETVRVDLGHDLHRPSRAHRTRRIEPWKA